MNKLIVLALSMMMSGFCFSAQELRIAYIIEDNVINDYGSKTKVLEQVERMTEEVNDYYEQSKVDIHFKITGTVFMNYDYEGSFSSILNDPNDKTDSGNRWENLREKGKFDADYIYFLVSSNSRIRDTDCGKAIRVNYREDDDFYDLEHRDYRFAVSKVQCGSDTIAHELGHLMGLAHGDLIASCKGSVHKRAVEPYAKGYAIGDCDKKYDSGEFGTLMVGNWISEVTGNTYYKVPLFSSPNLRNSRCGSKDICGSSSNGDAVRAMNKFKSDYRLSRPLW